MKDENEYHLLKMENMVEKKEPINQADENFTKIMFLYTAAIKELETKINIIRDEYKYFYDYELIDHIKTRIKTPESIIKKMENKKYKLTYNNLINKIHDIAGVRIICPLREDIFTIREILKSIPEIRVVKEKDYVTHPKKSGYSSYHMIVEVPVNLSHKQVYVKVEIQIRTMAMDFWASLEHDMKYKTTQVLDKKTSRELVSCAKVINKLDTKMTLLNAR